MTTHNDALLAELPAPFTAIHIAGGSHAVYTSSQMHEMYRKGRNKALAEQPAGAAGGVQFTDAEMLTINHRQACKIHELRQKLNNQPPAASADVGALRELAKHIVAVLGPSVPKCVTDQGAAWEWASALESAIRLVELIDSAGGAKCKAAGGSAECKPRDSGTLCQWCGGDLARSGVLTNPYTGKPRDYRDVNSDPNGTLCTPPGPLKAATPQPDEGDGDRFDAAYDAYQDYFDGDNHHDALREAVKAVLATDYEKLLAEVDDFRDRFKHAIATAGTYYGDPNIATLAREVGE